MQHPIVRSGELAKTTCTSTRTIDPQVPQICSPLVGSSDRAYLWHEAKRVNLGGEGSSELLVVSHYDTTTLGYRQPFTTCVRVFESIFMYKARNGVWFDRW